MNRLSLLHRSRLAFFAAVLLAAAGDLALAQRTANSTHRRELVGREFDARVVRVAGESRPIRIRLQGVDAPEQGEVFSVEAKEFLRRLVADATVRVHGRALDDYGRLVARITARGQDASTALVRAGLACHAYARDAALAQEESRARASGAGFWAPTAKKPRCVEQTAFSAPRRSGAARKPAEAREPARSPRESRGFRGNDSSKLYHASWCPNFNCRRCTRLFASEAEAKMAGFKPAGDCLGR
jgi:micrococcal nuclease